MENKELERKLEKLEQRMESFISEREKEREEVEEYKRVQEKEVSRLRGRLEDLEPQPDRNPKKAPDRPKELV